MRIARPSRHPAPALDELHVGDCLLYRPASFFGWLIAIKTWTMISHVEVYVGGGKSFASRDGKGVQVYPLRLSKLAVVRRPFGYLPKLGAALMWSKGVCGQAYDFRDLFTFLCLGRPSGDENKMICSEAATWFYREAGLDVVNVDVEAEAIAPSDLYKTGSLVTVWRDGVK